MPFPVTTPLTSTDAIPALLLLHVPPEVVSISVSELPLQIVPPPVIIPAAGAGLTVTEEVAITVPHPLEAVYVIVTLPGARPVTIPEALIVAIVGLLLLHEPPSAVSDNVILLN